MMGRMRALLLLAVAWFGVHASDAPIPSGGDGPLTCYSGSLTDVGGELEKRDGCHSCARNRQDPQTVQEISVFSCDTDPEAENCAGSITSAVDLCCTSSFCNCISCAGNQEDNGGSGGGGLKLTPGIIIIIIIFACLLLISGVRCIVRGWSEDRHRQVSFPQDLSTIDKKIQPGPDFQLPTRPASPTTSAIINGPAAPARPLDVSRYRMNDSQSDLDMSRDYVPVDGRSMYSGTLASMSVPTHMSSSYAGSRVRGGSTPSVAPSMGSPMSLHPSMASTVSAPSVRSVRSHGTNQVEPSIIGGV